LTVERGARPRSRRRPQGGRPGLRLAVKVALVLVVFALGVALGQALEDDDGGGVVTYRRTLNVPDETITVTVTAPG
jgi:hypothetical protein